MVFITLIYIHTYICVCIFIYIHTPYSSLIPYPRRIMIKFWEFVINFFFIYIVRQNVKNEMIKSSKKGDYLKVGLP
jgi:hypothetical protein